MAQPHSSGLGLRKAASIRAHLLVLVLALAVPLVAAIGLEIVGQMQQAVAHTKSALRTLAKTMASNTGGKIANASRTLERLALRPMVQALDPKNCDPILADLVNLNPDYANAVYTNLEGVVVCSAVSQPGGKLVNIGNTPWFKRLLDNRRFTVGEPFLGPITGKWVSVLATPIWNAQHEMVGSVQLPIELKAFDPNIPADDLPQGSRYGFFQDDGIMVWRNLDPEGVIGTRPDAEAARKIVALRDGEFESLAVDGVVRYFSVVPMPEVGWVAFVGVPTDRVYAAAKQRALATAAVALLALVVLVLLALAMARRISEPIVALVQTARAVQGGNRLARAASQGPCEVAEVANAFNAMTDGLQASARALEAEVAERKQVEAQVREVAFHDPLTHLPNRLLLNDRLSQALAASARGGVYCALMFLDLDHFKPLNDAHGHEVGDLLLIEVAARLSSCVRQADTVARFGGDEFVVVLSDLHADPVIAHAQAQAVAEKVRALLAAPYLMTVVHAGQPDVLVQHQCSASIGVALFAGPQASTADILKWADAAMYQAKKAGGNTVCFATPS
ncbi:diguanylate cyclase [Rhodoferax sp. AJA081-3]|uniref:diguanylate cyclase domain-containing protein n=1 Tax=Rhodoferax sp. AJA081-3 TaxID=2752316 RepID=UPI001ADF75BD|nr:diguanylate cyclase [Rhodoferax sp. AJA081-3]QTN27797.1 diguanylate cyclase [Rhodoferax sp. AJA081-3]